jgi:hypothetical protein
VDKFKGINSIDKLIGQNISLNKDELTEELIGDLLEEIEHCIEYFEKFDLPSVIITVNCVVCGVEKEREFPNRLFSLVANCANSRFYEPYLCPICKMELNL